MAEVCYHGLVVFTSTNILVRYLLGGKSFMGRIEEANFAETGYSYTLSLIAGKYKPIILYCLMEYEPVRFNEMQRYLGKVADKTLSMHLAGGFVMRSAFVYNFLIEANIMASIAIILMIPLRKFFRKQLGNSAICFGWLLVAIRLLCPLSLVNPLIHEIRSPFAADVAIRPIAGQIK